MAEQTPSMPRGIVGLRNIGNTSFLNCVIQCLAQSPSLSEYVLQKQYRSHMADFIYTVAKGADPANVT